MRIIPFFPVVDRVLMRREGYIKRLKLDRYPYGSDFMPKYFQELRLRKKAAVAWAAEAKPTIAFIGQMHVSLSGGNTLATRARTRAVQDWSYDRLMEQAKDAQIITFEQYGTDERVTPAVMVRITKESFRLLGRLYPDAPKPTEKQIEEICAADGQAASRAIRELKMSSIYCGEEWPNALESFLLMRLNNLPPDKAQIALQLVEDFDRLRSEIILIRTLEFLKKESGKKGVIMQGMDHGPHLAEVADEYHINLDLVMPTGN